MIYLITFILILIGVYKFDYRSSERGKLIYWIFLCVLLICIAGFRYRLGSDTIQYTNFYNNIHTIDRLRLYDFTKYRYSPGFILLGSLSKAVTDEFIFFQFVVAIIVNSIIFFFFWKNTQHKFFAVLLYFVFLYITLNMEVLREALAVSIFLLAWPFFRDKKWLKYYCMVLLAIMFHVSAIFLLFLPLICLPGIRLMFFFGTRTYIIGFLLLILSIAASYYFIDFIKMIAFTESIMERAQVYSKTDLGGLRSLNIAGILNVIIRFVLYPCIAMYFINKGYGADLKREKKIISAEMLTVLSIYVSLVSASIFILARYNNYLFFFPIIMMSDWVFTYLKVGAKKIRLQLGTWALVFLPLILFSTYTFYFNDANQSGSLKTYMAYYPYDNMLSKEMNSDREKLYKYYRSQGY